MLINDRVTKPTGLFEICLVNTYLECSRKPTVDRAWKLAMTASLLHHERSCWLMLVLAYLNSQCRNLAVKGAWKRK